MIRDSQSSDGMKAQTKSFLAFLTLLTAIYGFWLMVFWPGVLGQDSIAILLEVNDPINQASGKPASSCKIIRVISGLNCENIPSFCHFNIGAFHTTFIPGCRIHYYRS